MSARPRIVSLLPAATEMVCALGLRDALVGVSHECDHPAEVVGLPVLTRPRARLPDDSAGIDRDVRATLGQTLSLYEVDADRLLALRPDLVVTQDLCDVCAVNRDQVRAALGAAAGSHVELLSLSPTRLEHLFDDLTRLGGATGTAAQAGQAVAALRARIDAVAERAAALPARPAVLTIEWLVPCMVGGTWMPELVSLAGGRALVTRPGEHAPTLDDAALDALDPAPEVVLVKPCGYPLARTFAEWDTLVAMLADRPWPAVSRGALWVADGNAFFNRPGPRLVDSLEILAACVHPQAFADLAARHASGFRRIDLHAPAPR